MHQYFLSVVCVSHSLYLHLLTVSIFLFNNHLFGSPWSSIYFLNRSKFCLPPKQSVVGLIQPYLSLSVDLNLTFSSLITLQSQEHEPYFWLLGILFPFTTRKWKRPRFFSVRSHLVYVVEEESAHLSVPCILIIESHPSSSCSDHLLCYWFSISLVNSLFSLKFCFFVLVVLFFFFFSSQTHFFEGQGQDLILMYSWPPFFSLETKHKTPFKLGDP